MKYVKWLIIGASLVLTTSVFAQGKYFTLKINKNLDRYYLDLKTPLLQENVVNQYRFNIKPKDYDVYSLLWVKLHTIMEEEIFQKCDTNVSFHMGFYYNPKGELYDIFLSIPFAYFSCFSDTFFDRLYVLLASMTEKFPVSTLADLYISRLAREERKEYRGFFFAYFRVDKAMLDRMKNKYGSDALPLDQKIKEKKL